MSVLVYININNHTIKFYDLIRHHALILVIGHVQYISIYCESLNTVAGLFVINRLDKRSAAFFLCIN